MNYHVQLGISKSVTNQYVKITAIASYYFDINNMIIYVLIRYYISYNIQ